MKLTQEQVNQLYGELTDKLAQDRRYDIIDIALHNDIDMDRLDTSKISNTRCDEWDKIWSAYTSMVEVGRYDISTAILETALGAE